MTESKLGQRTSTVHIALSQGNVHLPVVVGYFTQSNINTEDGISTPLLNELHPPRPVLTSTKALRDGTESGWMRYESPYSGFRKAGQHIATFISRNTQPGMIDQWLTMQNGERFTQESLGYVVDSFPQLVETAHISEELSKDMDRLRTTGSQASSLNEKRSHEDNSLARSQWGEILVSDGPTKHGYQESIASRWIRVAFLASENETDSQRTHGY